MTAHVTPPLTTTGDQDRLMLVIGPPVDASLHVSSIWGRQPEIPGQLVSVSRNRRDAVRARVVGSRERKAVHGWIKPPLIASVGLLGFFIALAAVLALEGWGVVRLTSGSMSPALPSDSILLIRRTDASSVQLGDVVTVQGPQHESLTRRVVSVAPGIAPGEPTTLTLRGDASAAREVTRYTLVTVDVMVVGLPWGGQVVTAGRSPLLLAALSLALLILILVGWGLRHRHHARGPMRRGGTGSST